MKLVICHPSSDLYGSDLQMLETVSAAVAVGWSVVVTVPSQGPLVERLAERGATVRFLDLPVLRRSVASVRGLLRFAWATPLAAVRTARVLRAERADVLLVNTVTIPVALLAGRITRTPVVCHVHEAEESAGTLVRRALVAPLVLCTSIVVNSEASRRALTIDLPRLDARTVLVYNGVPAPTDVPSRPLRTDGSATVALVGRLAPRKGTDVAVEALGNLRREGREVRLVLCGSIFPGYEWFEEELRARAAQEDVAGAIEFAGYVARPWEHVAAADLVVVPSRHEPFGNVAVEGMLAGRPVVASAVQGLREIVTDGETGLLVPPGDPAALARAVAALLDDDELRARVSARGRDSARQRFGLERYRSQMLAALTAAASR